MNTSESCAIPERRGASVPSCAARMWTGAVWASVTMTLIGFVLPWVSVGPRATTPPVKREARSTRGRQSSMRLNGEVGRIMRKVGRDVNRAVEKASTLRVRISGIQVPRMANDQSVRLFTNPRERLGLKSYAVYLVPGLALLCGGLLTSRQRENRGVLVGVTLACATVVLVGTWQLIAASLRYDSTGLAIGCGLWMSSMGYLGLTLAALERLAPGMAFTWWRGMRDRANNRRQAEGA